MSDDGIVVMTTSAEAG